LREDKGKMEPRHELSPHPTISPTQYWGVRDNECLKYRDWSFLKTISMRLKGASTAT
jgi:hypothetical protein